MKRIQASEIYENIPNSFYETGTVLISKSNTDIGSKQTMIKICKWMQGSPAKLCVGGGKDQNKK